MRKFFFTTAACLGLYAMPAEVQAGYYTGNQMLEICESKQIHENGCLGFYAGVRDTLPLLGAFLPASNSARPNVCVPDGVTHFQLRDVAIKYMRAHPEDRHLLASALAMVAYAQAWPCPIEPGKPAKGMP